MSERDGPTPSPESLTWAQLQAEGHFDSLGEFSLDYQKSHSSLAKFFQPEGSDFLHFLLRFAICSSSGEVKVEALPNKFQIDFEATNVGRHELGSIWTSSQRNLRYLAMGLAGAWVQGVGQVNLETPAFSASFTSNAGELRASDPGCIGCRLTGTCSVPKDFDLSGFDHSFRELKRKVVRNRSLGAWLINLFKPNATEQGPGKVKIVSEQEPKFSIQFSAPNILDSHLAVSTKIPLPQVKVVVDGLALASVEMDDLPPVDLLIDSPDADLDLSLCNVIRNIPDEEFKSLRERVFIVLRTHFQDNSLLNSKTSTLPIGVLEWVVAKIWALGRYQEAERLCKLTIAQYSGMHPILCAMRERIAVVSFLELTVIQGTHFLFSKDCGWKKLMDLTHYQFSDVSHCLVNLLDTGLLDFETPAFVKAGLAQMGDRMTLSIYRHRIRMVCLQDIVDQDLLIDYEDSGYSSLSASFLVASHLLHWFKRTEAKSRMFEGIESSLLDRIYSTSAICCCQLLKFCDARELQVPLRPTDREGMWELALQLCSQARTLAPEPKNRPPQVNAVMPELFVLEALALARRGDKTRSREMLLEASKWRPKVYDQLSKEAQGWLEQEKWKWAKSKNVSN